MKSPQGFILYRIYYDDWVAYLGRTKQPLQTRLRGHFFDKPMHRKIDINGVSRVEYAECKTLADMYLYEIYYINKLHPPLNCDDKAKDDLTVILPELDWKPYDCPLMERWAQEIAAVDEKRDAARKHELQRAERRRVLRRMHATGELSDSDYEKILEMEGF